MIRVLIPLTAVFIVMTAGCERPNKAGSKVEVQEVATPKVVTYDEVAKDCKPFPFREKRQGKSYPSGKKWEQFLESEPRKGDDQFAYLKKLEEYQDKRAGIYAQIYCDTLHANFPSYEKEEVGFVLSLTPRCRWSNSRFTAWGAAVQPFASNLAVSGDRRSFTRVYAVGITQGAAIDAEKKKLFRAGEVDSTCDDDRYLIPVRVAYKALQPSDWIEGREDGWKNTYPTIEVLAWDAPEFQALIEKHTR